MYLRRIQLVGRTDYRHQLRALASALDVDVELVLFDSPGVLADAINDDMWDIANMLFEPERATHISFSQPYILNDANFRNCGLARH